MPYIDLKIRVKTNRKTTRAEQEEVRLLVDKSIDKTELHETFLGRGALLAVTGYAVSTLTPPRERARYLAIVDYAQTRPVYATDKRGVNWSKNPNEAYHFTTIKAAALVAQAQAEASRGAARAIEA